MYAHDYDDDILLKMRMLMIKIMRMISMEALMVVTSVERVEDDDEDDDDDDDDDDNNSSKRIFCHCEYDDNRNTNEYITDQQQYGNRT